MQESIALKVINETLAQLQAQLETLRAEFDAQDANDARIQARTAHLIALTMTKIETMTQLKKALEAKR